MRGPIYEWLIDQTGIAISDPDLNAKINDAVERTWFTSITDSMQISEFHHSNRLGGINHRPDWKTLSQFADPDKIRRVEHDGKFFRTRGPLNVPRSPQGRPVLIQAGSSNTGRDFAAHWAEAIFEIESD